jgi:peptidoglycan/xylan/chitin deacetylase (PgdA/CDA1 family)
MNQLAHPTAPPKTDVPASGRLRFPRCRIQSAIFALAALFLITCGSMTQAKGGEIALTFDDLPALTLMGDQAYVNDLNARLLRGLKNHHLPATGFVIEGNLDGLDRIQQIAILRSWLEAGMDLGNHSFSHESPNSIGADAYIEDIARGEPVTKALLSEYGKTMTWYRFPYLETGKTTSEKEKIVHWLVAHHYRIAPVTMNADDWEFAEPYDDALSHGDAARVAHIRQQYLQYTGQMIDWYQKAAHAVFGRGISYVMLLHTTRLNADCIDDLAALLGRHHLRGVSLEQAMKDPVYRIRDRYVGSDGIDWLERWSIALRKPLPWDSFADPPADIVADYNRVDQGR